MPAQVLRPYEDALRDGGSLHVHATSGRILKLDVPRWIASADSADATVLARCLAPVLDIGCGPGRLVAGLHERGLPALGIDIADTAVAMTRERGAPVVRQTIFAPVPLEGRWQTALLIDGNIGIGGDVGRLLRRVRRLLAPTGRLIVETDPDPRADVREIVRFARDGDPIGPHFPWARVGVRALAGTAAAAGFTGAVRTWSMSGRTFGVLTVKPVVFARGRPRR